MGLVRLSSFLSARRCYRLTLPAAAQVDDVETTLKRIGSHPGVLGCIITSPTGELLKSTCDAELTEVYRSVVPQLAELARSTVRDLDPQNDLQFLRVRSNKQEIMVAPNADFVLICIQKAVPGEKAGGLSPLAKG